MGGQTADGVFSLLSDGTRIDVLRAIAIAQNEEETPGGEVTALSFSEIYERVDVDNTSKLSYHLGELTGTFLRKHGDRYAFTHAGERMVRFVLAENYLSPPAFGPIEADGVCLFCGAAALEATLREQYFVVRCSACDRPAAGYVVTPAQVRSRSGEELLASLKQKQATEFELVRRGVCPTCAGPVESEVIEAGDSQLPDSVPIAHLTVDECRQCLRMYGGPLPHGVAYHPASVAFHWDRGIDVTEAGIWEFHEPVREGRFAAERIADDPPEYRVVLRRGDAELRIFLDANADVTRTERVRDRTVG